MNITAKDLALILPLVEAARLEATGKDSAQWHRMFVLGNNIENILESLNVEVK